MTCEIESRVRPASRPSEDELCVSLVQVKEDERLPDDDTTEDGVLRRRLFAAHARVQLLTGIALCPGSVFLCEFSGWPDEFFELNVYPLVSVVSFKYYTTGHTLTELDMAESGIIADLDGGRLAMTDTDFVRPELSPAFKFPIVIEVEAGNADLVPEEAKLAVSLLACHWFRNREAGYALPDQNHTPFWSMIRSVARKAIV